MAASSKAVYAYPSEHYPFWQTVRAQARVASWDEALPMASSARTSRSKACSNRRSGSATCCALRDCELAVSGPRFPCFKFNAAMGFEQAGKLMAQSGWCGFYLATRVPGALAAGEHFEVIAGPRDVGIDELFRARVSRDASLEFRRTSHRFIRRDADVLAYRHAFHAGNHADVFKHHVLTQVLRYMAGKDKPYTLIDTHAGAGGYSLQSRYAQKKAEYEQGIARLWARDDLPHTVADYVSLVRRFNDGGKLRQYPGSPAFAHMLLRPQDRLRLYELHPTDHRILQAYLGKYPNTQVTEGDGFAALKAELPPPSRRGVVLIDPSYEINSDYGRVVAALREALARFADAIAIVWYPQLLTLESSQLPHRLQASAHALAPKGWLHARLTTQRPDERGFGLVGSGLFIANPPFVLYETLQTVLPFLVEVLGQYDGAHFLLEHHAP